MGTTIKTEKTLLEEILSKLHVEQLGSKFPNRKIEQWRKINPERFLPYLDKALENGWQLSTLQWKAVEHALPATVTDHRSNYFLKTLTEWQTQDEVFFKKIKKLLESKTFSWKAEKTFFNDLATELCPDDQIYVLRIPRNSHWAAAIHILWDSIPDKLSIDRLLIYGEENSSATLYIEKFSESFSISIENIFTENNSRLNVHHLHRGGLTAESLDSAWVVQQKFFLSDHSHVCQGMYSSGGKLGKLFTEAHLEKHAVIESYGLHVGDHSHVDHDFEFFHNGSHSLSSLHFRMALLDDAYGIFRANIHIPPKSIACKAFQENKNLIMGENSKADAIPQLEILTEEVEASHGSATGELDEEELFYLMSRGLDDHQAQQLLLIGFFENIMQMALGEIQDSEGFQNPFLHDIWCAIQDRLHINFERYHPQAGED